MRSRVLYAPAKQIKEISFALNRRDEEMKTARHHPIKRGGLWVWGRWAWPAYYYTELTSPTRYFKNLGVLTTQLSNTWNPKRRSEPTRFDPSTPWPEAIRELKSSPPRYVIIAKNESFREFRALRQLLRKRYKRLSYSSLKVRVSRKRELFIVYQLREADTPKSK